MAERSGWYVEPLADFIRAYPDETKVPTVEEYEAAVRESKPGKQFKYHDLVDDAQERFFPDTNKEYVIRFVAEALKIVVQRREKQGIEENV